MVVIPVELLLNTTEIKVSSVCIRYDRVVLEVQGVTAFCPCPTMAPSWWIWKNGNRSMYCRIEGRRPCAPGCPSTPALRLSVVTGVANMTRVVGTALYMLSKWLTDGIYEAVKLAFTLTWSDGQVESQVNRLKMLKRQVYGRAGFKLFRRRILFRSG